MTADLAREVERFLYAEARLLDERHYEKWLALFTEDCRYFMPIMTTRERGMREVSDDRELAHFDDNKRTLSLRVKRLATNFAYAEDPPSRTVRFVSNVEAELGAAGEVMAHSAVMVYRTRLETTTDFFAGRRDDVLRRDGSGWTIARRKITLATNVLQSNNLSIFF